MSKNHRLIICSLPKSGTYLIASLLEKLGYRSNFKHITLDGYQKLPRTKEEELFFKDPLRGFVSLDFESMLDSIEPGEFTMSHLLYTPSLKIL